MNDGSYYKKIQVFKNEYFILQCPTNHCKITYNNFQESSFLLTSNSVLVFFRKLISTILRIKNMELLLKPRQSVPTNYLHSTHKHNKYAKK